MNKIIITVIIASLLTACTTNKATSENRNGVAIEENLVYAEIENDIELANENDEEDVVSVEISDNIKGFKEYETIEETIELNNHYIEIVEDNFGKRVMIIKDDHNQEVYKTIFTKKTNRLKIIAFDKGQIFSQIIS